MTEQAGRSLSLDSESSGPRPPASVAVTTAAVRSSMHSKSNNNSTSNNNTMNNVNSANNANAVNSANTVNNHNQSQANYNSNHRNGSLATASATADAGSSRPPPASGVSTAALPLSSLTFGRGTSMQLHSRKRGGPMTLYVRADGSEGSETHALPIDTRDDGASAATEVNGETPAEDEHGEGVTAFIWNMFETLASALHNLTNMIPDVLRHLGKSRFLVEMFVFLFFCITFVFLLGVTQERIEWMAKISAYDNEQSLLISTSLTEELFRKANEVKESMMMSKQLSPGALEETSMLMRNLSIFREKSLELLHSRLHYPGPMEDIKFLVEEHVAYKINLARLVKEELDWLDEKRHNRVGSGDSPGGSKVMLKPKRRSRKQYNKHDDVHNLTKRAERKKHTEEDSKPEVMLQPAHGDDIVSHTEPLDMGLLNFLTLTLKNRVVALFVVFLLVVLYIRMS